MIIGFGNNTVSSLAADITANQATIQVMPGEGAKFAKLLSSDYVNTSNPLKVYAKITLTDAKETVFEVCHLTAVNNDMLTVVRGQEGTTAKGWALNDVVANFATRGSENQFIQIEQLQSGNYTSGVAGGSANALTIELPATYFVNSSTHWALRTPIIVYPTQNNTGASTLQLVMGGRVLGTFPLYKGNKAQLVANDILKDVGLVCLMDKTKTFFNVANPGAIYAGLGTAAFKDVVTSMTDTMTGRVPVVGWMGLGGNSIPVTTTSNSDLSKLPAIPFNAIREYKASDGSVNLIGISGISPSGNLVEWLAPENGSDGKKIAVRNKDSLFILYSTGNKPTASDVGAVPVTRKVNGHELSSNVDVTSTDIFDGQAINLGANKNLNDVTTPGIYFQSMNANTSLALNYPEAQAGALVVYKNAGITQEYRVYNSSRIYSRSRYSTDSWTLWAKEFNTLNKPSASDVEALPISGGILNGNLTVKNQIQVGGVGNGVLNIGDSDSGLRSSIDGQVNLYANGRVSGYWNTTTLAFTGQIIPTNYANFDARYYTKAQSDAGYAPMLRSYSKVESDSRYVTAVRLGSRATTAAYPQFFEVPTGCVITGLDVAGDSNATVTAYYRPIQVYLNGAWRTVGAA